MTSGKTIRGRLVGLLGASLVALAMGGCGGVEEQGSEAHFDEEGAVGQSSQAVARGSQKHRIAIGGNHGLAIRQDGSYGGTLFSWGYNGYGQLGDNSTTQRNSPVQVLLSGLPLNNIVSVAGGASHSLALLADGRIWAWGYNGYGQLGNGTTSSLAQATPLLQSSLTDVTSVASGQNYSMALTSDGYVHTWGYNGSGQIGIGTTTGNQLTPIKVTTAPGVNLSQIVAIAAGANHALALQSDGTVWAWGYNYYGQVGGSKQNNQTRAVQMTSLSDVVDIGAGMHHSVALTSDGKVFTWGYNGFGEFGNGSATPDSFTPVQASITQVKAIAVGYNHTLALRTDGNVYAWGRGGNGQLGDALTANRNTPYQIASVSNVKEIAAGAYTSFAVLGSAGTIKSWGANANGELGTGSTGTIPSLPQTTGSLGGEVQVSAGESHTIVLKWDGSVWGYGYNAQNQLGDGSTTRRLTGSRVRINATPTYLENITSVAAGAQHSIGLRADGTVWAWGDNDYGQSGQGTMTGLGGTVNQPFAIQVKTGPASFLTNIVAIAAGSYHSLALDFDGHIWAWGRNYYGQLGMNDGAYQNQAYAVKVANEAGFVAIGAGGNHSIAIKATGSTLAWGRGTNGQLCDGFDVNTPQDPLPLQNPDPNAPFAYTVDYPQELPDMTSTLRRPIAVAAGLEHTLILMSDGTAYACGANSSGQLGTTDDPLVPNVDMNVATQVPGILKGIRIVANGNHSHAMESDGAIFSWGENNYGQLGLGSLTNENGATQLPSITGVPGFTGLAAGTSHVVVVKPNGTLMTWGKNNQGQLANGTYGATNQTLPVSSNFVP